MVYLERKFDEIIAELPAQNIIIFGYYAGNHKAINPKLPE
jgi:hypothetical protein